MKKLLSVLFGSVLVFAMAMPVFATPSAVPQDQTTSTTKAKKAKKHHAKKAKKEKKAKSTSGSGM
ncbi:MAG: hypothetical protein ACRD3T_18700 [Terriglobia bacterium]